MDTNSELEMVKRLYERSKEGNESQAPKQGIFNWRCPKCNSKLNRKSYKAPLFAEEGEDEFANRVINDQKLDPGLYNITVNNFSCSCGYEHIGIVLDQVEM